MHMALLFRKQKINIKIRKLKCVLPKLLSLHIHQARRLRLFVMCSWIMRTTYYQKLMFVPSYKVLHKLHNYVCRLNLHTASSYITTVFKCIMYSCSIFLYILWSPHDSTNRRAIESSSIVVS